VFPIGCLCASQVLFTTAARAHFDTLNERVDELANWQKRIQKLCADALKSFYSDNGHPNEVDSCGLCSFSVRLCYSEFQMSSNLFWTVILYLGDAFSARIYCDSGNGQGAHRQPRTRT
jgi:hypothetical protein